ncbi:MAG: hypothetical protein M1826_002045 [Phylliscum demangeonii]|nr:MAG: hypothetical protein M1826_002045 [Phylliscum demangeonii]
MGKLQDALVEFIEEIPGQVFVRIVDFRIVDPRSDLYKNRDFTLSPRVRNGITISTGNGLEGLSVVRVQVLAANAEESVSVEEVREALRESITI